VIIFKTNNALSDTLLAQIFQDRRIDLTKVMTNDEKAALRTILLEIKRLDILSDTSCQKRIIHMTSNFLKNLSPILRASVQTIVNHLSCNRSVLVQTIRTYFTTMKIDISQ